MLRKFDTTKDAELLVAGEVEAFVLSFPGSRVPLNLVTQRIKSIELGRAKCTVVDEGGPKGYVVWTKRATSERVEIYVESIYIEPEFRGRGLLEKLLSSLSESSVESRITLDVSVSNDSAVSSYRSLGFETQRLRMTKSSPPKG